MRVGSLLSFICLFFCCNGESRSIYSAVGYHEKFGIPQAREILFAESLRIIGGKPVQTNTAFPYQAGLIALLTTKATSICGGSLISNSRVLTAAHCWNDGENKATQFTVVLGSTTIFNGGTRVVTKDVVMHPNWNTQAVTHDLAIARISPVTFSTQNSFPTTTTLSSIELPIITNLVCQQSFSMQIQNSHLCTSGAGKKGTCDGDSGGPLTVLWNNNMIQVGIVSFGGDSCQAGHPSVFTRVTAFLSWINSV